VVINKQNINYINCVDVHRKSSFNEHSLQSTFKNDVSLAIATYTRYWVGGRVSLCAPQIWSACVLYIWRQYSSVHSSSSHMQLLDDTCGQTNCSLVPYVDAL